MSGMDSTRTMSSDYVLDYNEHVVDGEGRQVGGEGSVLHVSAEIREVWTNGSGMFGPADGVDRCIGHVRERETVTVDGVAIAGPWKLVRSFDEALDEGE